MQILIMCFVYNSAAFAATVFDHTAFVWRNMELRIAISGSYLTRDLQTLF